MRVLVVDDNIDSAVTLGKLLEFWGYEVIVVYDGYAALEAALIHQPKVAFIDIGLPGIDCYELARRLRQEPTLEGMLLIAATGYGEEEDRRKSREAEFNYHFTKPLNLSVVQQLLQRT